MTALDKYNALLQKVAVEGECMPNLRGSLDAKWVLFAPPTEAEEYQKQVPLSSKDAVVLHAILQKANLDTDYDFLVVPCIVCGDRCKKFNTAPIKDLLSWMLTESHYKGFVCVGADAFKHILGRGAKPKMSSLVGNVMNMPVTNYKPVVVFPDIKGLYVSEETKQQRTREAFFAARNAEYIAAQINKALTALNKIW